MVKSVQEITNRTLEMLKLQKQLRRGVLLQNVFLKVLQKTRLKNGGMRLY